jgi:hypothetical protein
MKGVSMDGLKDVRREVTRLGIGAIRGQLEAERSEFATKAETEALRRRIESAEQRASALEARLTPKSVVNSQYRIAFVAAARQFFSSIASHLRWRLYPFRKSQLSLASRHFTSRGTTTGNRLLRRCSGPGAVSAGNFSGTTARLEKERPNGS